VRIVLDTNVVISATFHGGVPMAIVEAARAGRVVLCVTAEIVAEYQEILTRFFGPDSDADVAIVLDGLLADAVVVTPSRLAGQVSVDPDDDKFIACAVAAGANLIVSGDKHLLTLQGKLPVEVLRPRDALSRIP